VNESLAATCKDVVSQNRFWGPSTSLRQCVQSTTPGLRGSPLTTTVVEMPDSSHATTHCTHFTEAAQVAGNPWL
jgi:hypothetical protein